MSCFSWTFPSQKRTASKEAAELSLTYVSHKVVEDDGWRTWNELSVTSTASGSSNCLVEDLFAPESEDEPEFGPQPEPVRVELQDEHLFFQGDGRSIDETVRVEALEESPTGTLRVLAPGQALEAVAEDLLVDCRATPQDDPKLTKLIGTRLCEGGRTSRLLIRQSAAAATASIFCEILTTSCGVEAEHTVPLAEAVAAVREAQRRRDQAADLRRQRQLNDRLMGQKRRQALGLS